MSLPLDRTQPPAPGPLRSFEFPPVPEDSLGNGLALRIVRLDRLPLVSTMLVLDAGEALLPAFRSGMAQLTGRALQGGTGRRSGEALAEALENLGVELGVSTGWDATTISLTSHADRLADALALVSEIVLTPSFPEAEIDRVRGQRLASLRQRRMSPSALAEDLTGYLVYPPGHPYARPASGVAEAVSGFDRVAAREWHAQRYRPGGAGLVVVGDVDPDEVRELATASFGDWTGEVSQPTAETPQASGDPGVRMVVAHRPGAVQSELRIGTVGVGRRHPDFFALQVLNTILGGAFTSRLNLNLRERNGFTYGVRSRFSFRRGSGPFTISTAVGTDVTVDAVGEALGELKLLLEEGPREEEVSAARDFLAGIFPLQMETSDRIASQITRLILYGLPSDHLSTYRDRIRGVSLQDAWEAGRRVLGDAAYVVLVVGDADEIAPGLEELGHGPVEILSEDSLPPFYPNS